MSADCLFCRIVRGELAAKLIAENDDCVAFRDINPQAPVHVLVIPRQHVASLDALRDGRLLGQVGLLAAEIARAEGIAATGYRTVINTGSDAGQSVAHLHMHLLGGRSLQWPPG
jgi:histidine triad (HIT) family protein